MSAILSAPTSFELPTELKIVVQETIFKHRQQLETLFSSALPTYRRLVSQMDPASILNLATSVFMSGEKIRTKFIGMPFHLAHRMQENLPRLDKSPVEALDQYWVYDKVSSTIIREIVSLCGLDPNTCTHAQLEDAAPYVDCLTCTNSKVPRMKWDQAIHHWRKVHKTMHETGSAWRVLSPLEKEKFDPIWMKLHSEALQFECLMCHDTRTEPNPLLESKLYNHLRTFHHVTAFDTGTAPYRVPFRPVKGLEPFQSDKRGV